jgi:hypothetical protein
MQVDIVFNVLFLCSYIVFLINKCFRNKHLVCCNFGDFKLDVRWANTKLVVGDETVPPFKQLLHLRIKYTD